MPLLYQTSCASAFQNSSSSRVQVDFKFLFIIIIVGFKIEGLQGFLEEVLFAHIEHFMKIESLSQYVNGQDRLPTEPASESRAQHETKSRSQELISSLAVEANKLSLNRADTSKVPLKNNSIYGHLKYVWPTG